MKAQTGCQLAVEVAMNLFLSPFTGRHLFLLGCTLGLACAQARANINFSRRIDTDCNQRPIVVKRGGGHSLQYKGPQSWACE